MENHGDIVRVKEELKDSPPDTDDDNFGSVNSYEAKNFETSTFNKSSAYHMYKAMHLRELVNEKISIEFECENYKQELKPLSTPDCKTEYPSYLPIVKIENENQTDAINQNLIIDFECKDVKLELKSISTTNCKTEDQCYSPVVKIEKQIKTSHSNEKSPMILMKKEVNHDNDYQFEGKSRLKLNKSKVNRSVNRECEFCLKSFRSKRGLKIHINTIHNSIKPFECKLCHKSFRQKNTLNTHIIGIHDRRRLFECDIWTKM
ncbi:MDS1 and EVI1 complex locus protein EVI1-like [Trichogramma pretiosum]|uniref:MDS1 and EVI1 complex locus protein EVI1-like n=1 Tax=Trichogramma pretiosum TaxID=7493 RepID=UPI000C71BB97|nr:MDS1 and EVI1 complex locus protein EVI1-like [Trichogramma pretiosum]